MRVWGNSCKTVDLQLRYCVRSFSFSLAPKWPFLFTRAGRLRVVCFYLSSSSSSWGRTSDWLTFPDYSAWLTRSNVLNLLNFLVFIRGRCRVFNTAKYCVIDNKSVHSESVIYSLFSFAKIDRFTVLPPSQNLFSDGTAIHMQQCITLSYSHLSWATNNFKRIKQKRTG